MTNITTAQLSENFETGLPTSYTTETEFALQSGTWIGTPNQVIRGSTGNVSGMYSLQLRSQTDASITTPLLSDGVGTITFSVTASTASGGLQVLSSEDGTVFTQISGSPISFGTTTTEQSFSINNPDLKYIRFRRTGATVFLDDVNISVAPTIEESSFTFEGYFEDFNLFDGSGFSANPEVGQLNSKNWKVIGMSDDDGTFGGEFTSGDFARGSSTGGVSIGGVYSFSVGNDVKILGVQPGGSDFTPGAVILRLQNTTGELVNSIKIAYDIFVYNDQDRSSSFNFSYSTDGENFSPVTKLDYTTPQAADVSPNWEKESRSTKIRDLALGNDDFLYLRWDSGDVGGSGNRDEFGITNVSITSIFDENLTGSEGYRMLSSPVPTTVGELLNDNDIFTQCFTGAIYIADECDNNPLVFSNVYRYNSDGVWVSVDNATDEINAAEAILVYVYENDDPSTETGPNPWPKTISVSGIPHSLSPVNAPIRSGAGDLSFVGNPSFDSITPLSVAGNITDLKTVIYVWDPNYSVGITGETVSESGSVGSGAWRSFNGEDGSITDGIIKPFQGFFVQNVDELTGTPSLQITEGNTTSGGQFYGKQQESFSAQFILSGQGMGNSAWLTFSDYASLGDDRADAKQLEPLSGSYAVLGTINTDGDLLDINNLPFFEGEIDLPLVMNVTTGGEYTFSVSNLNLPNGYSSTLVDTESGSSYNLDADFELTIQLEPTQRAKSFSNGLSGQPTVMASATSDTRFKLRLSDQTITSTDGTPSDLPAVVSLSQNYPNPFNPTTRMSYELPAESEVKLAVYDLLGRQVAVLVNNRMAPGSHNVNFDGASLSSGVYVIRLEAGGEVITRKMTLLK
ncbi:MAG: T9SS type A sorting domain-containing protein [Balneolales bacterium]|nr:T9SS type A sorting domain-containing protein [Balneolales bacterium]